jgi:hypothetical protein
MEALLRTGDHDGARAVGEALLGARSVRLGPGHPWTLLSAVQLGYAEHALGSAEALAHLVRFTQELHRTAGEHDERTLHARILVQAAVAPDGTAEAAELAASNLRDCLQHLGPHHRFTDDARRAAALT